MEVGGILLALLVAAALVEGFVEFAFGKVLNDPWPGYIALALGVAVCVIWQLDLLAELGMVAIIPFAGQVATGILVGRGSNYLHDFVAKFLPTASARSGP